MGLKYLLDTNACAAILNARTSRVKDRAAATPADQICICSVVKAELRYGALKSAHAERNLALLERLFERVASYPFDDAAATKYGEIRLHVERQGTPIGPNDLMIASITVARGLVLVTHNRREFERVPGLTIEDWEGD